MIILMSRAATKKTPKNSLDSISTRWKKSSWPCWRLFLLLLHLLLRTRVQRILRRGRTRNLDLLLAPATQPPPTPAQSRSRWCRMRMRMEMGGWRLGSGIGRLLRVRYVFFSFSSLVLLLCRVFQYFIALFLPSSHLSVLPSIFACFVAYFLTNLLVY